MEYTLKNKRKQGFMCSECYQVSLMDVRLKVSGEDKKSSIPRFAYISDMKGLKVSCGRCGNLMIPIDKNIINSIKALNQMEYTTSASCGGSCNMTGYGVVGNCVAEDFRNKAQALASFVPPYVTFSPNITPGNKELLWKTIQKMICKTSDNYNPFVNIKANCFIRDIHMNALRQIPDPMNVNAVIEITVDPKIVEEILRETTNQDDRLTHFYRLKYVFTRFLKELVRTLDKEENEEDEEDGI